MIGRTISHYTITEELGRGGMGVVYKAEDTTLKRTVALKFLSPHLLTDEPHKKRFLHEAQAAAALDHPNISTIHEVHEADGHTFMVMAFIEGEDLGEKMASEMMDVSEALDIAIQVARGLAKAHGEGIVHRDIKPGNVLITSEGHAKIVDFGLAKLATQTRLTRTGTSMGTVRYMSPEQAGGGEVDHRTDIWSLGVVLYEMLAGQAPFRGEMEPAMIYSIMNEDPEPLTSIRKDVPVQLEDIVEKALAKQPDKRYQAMSEFLSELETLKEQITLGITERKFRGMRKLRRRKRLAAGVAAIVVIALAVVWMQRFYHPGTGIHSLAVLPFSNLSGDEAQEYFSDGMTEMLINEVGQISALRVISRTSVMQLKKTDKSLKEIAEALHVDAVVEASVVRTGDRIRITAQLIRVEPEEMLWSESYNREGRDVAILLSEVTRAIADRIKIALTPEEEERLASVRTVDPEAHNAYLKGLYQREKWTEEGFKRGLQYFREAIDIDPTYAPAWYGMAACHAELSLYGYAPPREAAAKAKAAIEKALDLDDTLAEAHALHAWINFIFDWNWSGPDQLFRQAIELNPNDPKIRLDYSSYLMITGRPDKSIAENKKAIELDPLTASTTGALGWAYFNAGKYDESMEQFKKSDEMDPTKHPAILFYAQIYVKKGMCAEAIALCDSAWALAPSIIMEDAWVLSTFGRVYAECGQLERAREHMDHMMTLSKRKWIDPFYVAGLYKGMGKRDSAFTWLERCYQQHSPNMVFLKLDHAQLSDDPRYVELLRKVGIPID